MGIFRHLAILLAALTMALGMGAPAARAQTSAGTTITNTAAANWFDQGAAHTVSSNTVAITVENQPVSIETFKLQPNGTQSLMFNAANCGGQPIAIPGIGVGQATVTSLASSATVRIGGVLFFKLTAASANRDPAAIDSLTATLVTTAGDRETIVIHETDPNSGVFVGAVPTGAIPPQPVTGDCRLSVAVGDHVSIECSETGRQTPIASAEIEVLADPSGLVFDSADGTPIDGARVSLVDALTGAPARVFGDDGITPWPSTVISGSRVTDGTGQMHQMQPGEYRFPFTALGTYRLVIEPPAPYAAPSAASPAELARLLRPNGEQFTIVPASYGKDFTLNGPAAVRVDIPIDSPAVPATVTKVASRASALPGDVVFYTVTVTNPDLRQPRRGVVLTDLPAPALRPRLGSVRIDGAAPAAGAVRAGGDGRSLTIALGDMAPATTRTVTYAMSVRATAGAGQAINTATVSDAAGNTATAGAIVQIEREDLAARLTLVGRVSAGSCDNAAPGLGIPGVRLVLEDGSFAITDADGRYHFAGLMPGSHVVQALTATLPKGGAFVDCTASTRSAGSASSRFVIGQGGQVLTADFRAALPADALAPAAAPLDRAAVAERELAAERLAAGADIDWLTRGDGPTEFLFPAADHNPRAPAVRVAIRHRATEKVELLVDGQPVDPVAYDGLRTAPGGTHAVSLWRGIPLDGEVTRLSAVIRNEAGAAVQTLVRDVHFSATAARVELLPAQSRLIADGATRPVLALRLLDRNGRPVHAGLSGEFALGAPYESAEALDAMQSRALSGLGRAAPRWLVRGDDGVAFVELAPTMASGKLRMEFTFANGEQRRRQELEAWIVPGRQPWTVVGLAEASAGTANPVNEDARVAVYAKGPVSDDVQLTLAYDSAKQRAETPLLGTIDPRAYYTVFADGSDRRFDAASREKLYARVESRGMSLLYGDFNAGFEQTQLARYVRTATGLRGEVAQGGFHAAGFAARIASDHRHDEFQGSGISGPYRLTSRAIIAGSEVVAIEVRDRFRSEVIVSRRSLTRFVDYSLDLFTGTITFKEPVLSRDADLNPQFIVVDYELDDTARGGEINAGLRADYTAANGALRIGASALSDTSANAGTRTSLGSLDVRARLGQNLELRAEAGMSVNAGETAAAWLIEAEHHSARFDALAYARMAEADFGLGQTAGAERGRRKVGLDARYQLSEALSVSASLWDDASLADSTHRRAAQLGALYRTRDTDARIGLATMQDRLADGSDAGSTVLEGGLTRRALDNKLEVSAASSFALGAADSLDLPTRHRLTARYAVTPAVRLVGTYEVARGSDLETRTARAGLELTPWAGSRLTAGLGQQGLSEYGKRSFAAFGLTQSLEVSRSLTLDATFDSSHRLAGFDTARLLNAAHPASSGGFTGDAGTLAEDFTATTFGATWRGGRWSLTGRGEWRDGQVTDNRGVTLGAIRQLGEGAMLGGAMTWTRAEAAAGATTTTFNAALAAARRPADSTVATLAKLEFRADSVANATAGQTAGGSALSVTGDARSSRLIGSLALDWSPRAQDRGQFVQRSVVSLFGAVRHNFDRYEDYDLAGTTLLAGIDARYGVTKHFDLGARATVRHNLSDKVTDFSFGPELGLNPARDVLLTLGYNVTGYRDRDFSAAQYTTRGVYVAMRFKFDAGTFGFLGLER